MAQSDMLIVIVNGLFLLFSWPWFRIGLIFFQHHHIVRSNYKGDQIPIGTGMLLWVACIVYGFIWHMLFTIDHSLDHVIEMERLNLLLITQSIIFIAGWLDDQHGDTFVKGFHGHVGLWLEQRNVSTGLVKIAAACIASCWFFIPLSENLWRMIFSIVFVILMTNMLNLLDVRPGRCIKGYMFIMGLVVCSLLFTTNTGFELILPMLWGSLLLLPYDVKGKAMLGDAGSNLLGFHAGIAVAICTPLTLQLALFAIVVLLHWMAERTSLSKWIEKSPLLSWLDRIGRVT